MAAAAGAQESGAPEQRGQQEQPAGAQESGAPEQRGQQEQPAGAQESGAPEQRGQQEQPAGAQESGAPEQRGQQEQPAAPGRRAVYFCGSFRGGREDPALYERIVSRLRRLGTVLTERVLDVELGPQGEQPAEGDRFIGERDLALLQRADLIVAEVTQPSLGVGYEVGRIVALNKRILCLLRLESGRVLSAMIRGAADHYRFQVWDYEVGDVEVMLDRYFAANRPEQVASSLDPTT